MRLPSRDTLKDAFWGALLFIVVATTIDEVNKGLSLPKELIEIALIGLGAVAIYVWLLRRTHSNILGRSDARAALFCGSMFSAGFVVGIVGGLANGWDWSYVGLIVPALMAWFCFKVLFHVASASTSATPKSADSP